MALLGSLDTTLVDIGTRVGYLLPFVGVGVESLGVPVPGETALVVAAVLAAQGHLSPWGVAGAAIAGAVLGDNAGYWIGRRWGTRLIAVRGIRRIYTPERLALAESFFGKRRAWVTVFLARWIALLRILAGPLAGMHRMPWKVFLPANIAGGACWVAMVTGIGLAIGSNLDRALAIVSRTGLIGLLLAVVVVGAWIAWLVLRHRAEHRAGAAALRRQDAADRDATERDSPG